MEFYNYDRNGTAYELAPPTQHGLWCSEGLSYPTAVASELVRTPAAGEYYAPRGSQPAPLVVIAHGMGDTSLVPARLLAGALQGAGWACYVPHLPILAARTPRMAHPQSLRPQDWADLYRLSVVEVRQALDWAEGRRELDHARTAIVGVSFGGFVAAISMGVDRRLGAGVLVESGGNSIAINELSRTMRRRFPGPPVDYAAQQRRYRAYLQEVARRGLDAVTPPELFFWYDPLTFAADLKGRPLFLIGALQDEIIPRACVREMWQATGRGELLWLPGTHLTIWLWYPLISLRLKRFLKHALA